MAEEVAELYGISKEEATERLITGRMDAMVRNRTGRGLAPIHKLKKKSKK